VLDDRLAAVHLRPVPALIPVMPLGPHKGQVGIGAASGVGIAWLYDDLTGASSPTRCPERVSPGGVLGAAVG